MMAGGSVPYPGMEMGGIVSHTHPELHSHGPSKIDPGFIRELAPKMQVGGVVPQPQLFEEGDAEVNDALNMMASVAKPDVPDMPMPMMDEKVEVREEVTEDQGPSNFKAAVTKLKDTFTEEIENYIKQAGSGNIGQYLKSMNVAYNNQLNNLRKQFKVEKVDPEDQLFTPQFLSGFMEDIPGMENSGISMTQERLDEMFGPNQISIKEFNNLKPYQQSIVLDKGLLSRIEQNQTTAGSSPDLSRLRKLLDERRGLAKQAGSVASSAFATTGSAAGELLGKRAAGKAAELGAMDTALAGEIDLEKALINAQARSGTRGGGLDFTADESSMFTLRDFIDEQKKDEADRKLWQDVQEKTRSNRGAPDLGKALLNYFQITNGKNPPPYEGEERFIKELENTDRAMMSLSEYYFYMLEKGNTDPNINIESELEKWFNLPAPPKT
tara:strand:- start:2159 stop:3475 length:1317 start_codon:yes stop_codon:yes gene_type:complete